jgi:hypothetical protein
MPAKKILLGEMWKSEANGEVYIVTSFCRELFSSYACLRNVNPQTSQGFRRAKMLTTDSGETLDGFRIAELI